jgi:hypothetical protein
MTSGGVPFSDNSTDPDLASTIKRWLSLAGGGTLGE